MYDKITDFLLLSERANKEIGTYKQKKKRAN
jgi:hypothetical protein